MLRSKFALIALVLALPLLPGCRSLGTGRGTGAVIGTALGTGAGYAIGRHNGDKWAGAAIGALAGGVAGYAIGDEVDPERRTTEPYPPVRRADASPAPPLDGNVRVTRTTVPVSRGDRVIVRDIYPDGTVHERVIELD